MLSVRILLLIRISLSVRILLLIRISLSVRIALPAVSWRRSASRGQPYHCTM
jgi:hypothetical protein